MRPLAAFVVADSFRRAFDGWCNGSRQTVATLARCLSLTQRRVAELRRGQLPTDAELNRLADAMEWPVDRLSALVELSREAAAVRDSLEVA
jgi:hypothetical protein